VSGGKEEGGVTGMDMDRRKEVWIRKRKALLSGRDCI
jgi:hypothetical protein